MQRRWIEILSPLIACALAIAASAQSDTSRAKDDEVRAKLLGALVNTQVTLSTKDVPVQLVFERLAEALEVPIIVRFDKEGDQFGLDPSTRVSLKVQDRRALDVIEDILDQCESYEPCTWQLRRGFVEVGTKTRLSAPAARETRMYLIRDLMIEAPRFAAERAPNLGKYGVAMLGTPATATYDHGYSRRKMPEELATEIVEGIVEIIEPGHWNYGQDDDESDETLKPEPAAPPAAAPGAAAPGVPAATSSPAGAAVPPAAGADVRLKRWAAIRLWRDQLIINAPDFIHRQVDGYPRAIGPSRKLTVDIPPAPQPAATQPQSADDGSDAY